MNSTTKPASTPSPWPPAQLGLCAPDPQNHDGVVQLRLVDDRSILHLGVRNQAEDIFADPTAAWAFGWLGAPPAEIISFSYSSLASLTPKDERTPWELKLACFKGDGLMGTTSLRRIVAGEQVRYDTGSYLFREFQGQGYGRLMRRMILHLAFEGLGIPFVESIAHPLNAASVEVSSSLGYEHTGETPSGQMRWVMRASQWQDRPRTSDPAITMTGVEGLAAQLRIPQAP